ncbi:hypothetical protein BDV40DRAFT_265288 [Aspergillus tamarii]|uniref:Uncharacterized protein n=1 Tax=Aspergillus tamarii TaxID=41984 RepID=A0A5N6UVF9_ASPTM|nr:hypothetical protein BDV40DRAFT_265288 [Aspergillus tamarii]
MADGLNDCLESASTSQPFWVISAARRHLPGFVFILFFLVIPNDDPLLKPVNAIKDGGWGPGSIIGASSIFLHRGIQPSRLSQSPGDAATRRSSNQGRTQATTYQKCWHF